MSALYLHIPFCRTRCIYCDFYSGVNLKTKQRYVDALCLELMQRSDYLSDRVLQSVYFGGGTPSLLSIEEFGQLFAAIRRHFMLDPTAEITVECNPDDVSKPFLYALRELGVNRISMGAQSFSDAELRFLNRRHSAAQIITAIADCRSAGIHNISIDLMYGLPMQTDTTWQATLDQAMFLGIQHLSAYSLMYEEGTALTRLLEKGTVQELSEEQHLSLFNRLLKTTEDSGYEMYEISNFCLPGFQSRHNSAYWKTLPYLGIGAAAHSFNGHSRQWNCADTELYFQSIEQGRVAFKEELLSEQERYNEFVFTALRTREGISLIELESRFGKSYLDYCLNCSEKYLLSGRLEIKDPYLRLTRDGIFISDQVMSDMMKI